MTPQTLLQMSIEPHGGAQSNTSHHCPTYTKPKHHDKWPTIPVSLNNLMKLGQTYKPELVTLSGIGQTLIDNYMLQVKHCLRFALHTTTKGQHSMALQPQKCYSQATMLQQLQAKQRCYITAYIKHLGVCQKHVRADQADSLHMQYAYPDHQPKPSYQEPNDHRHASCHAPGIALSLVSQRALYGMSSAQLSNGLVTPAAK